VWKETESISFAGSVVALDWRAQLNELAVGLSWDSTSTKLLSTLYIWRQGKDERLPEAIDYVGPLNCVKFSPNGKFLAWSGGVGLVRLIDLEGTPRIFEIDTVPIAVGESAVGFGDQVEFTRDSRILLSGGDSRKILMWDVTTGTRIR
jgi:WD40 repeat protein